MTSDFDPTRRYIRIVAEHPNGMVEFEFAVGEPGLFVEMQLPQAAFADFCAMQGVTPSQAPVRAERDALHSAAEQVARELGWTLHDAITHQNDPRP